MTPEELQEIERAHENAIWRHNREARPWATMRRAARLTAALTAMRGERDCLFVLAEHIQTDLEAVTRANARADATIADLPQDLPRARQVNEQAERVRDENDRLRRDLAAVRAELQALHNVLSGAREGAATEGRAAK